MPLTSSSIKFNLIIIFKGDNIMIKCKCGKEFSTNQSFRGHRSHCIECVGEERYNYNHQLTLQKQRMMVNAYTQKRLDAKNERISKWISEQHTCERCGKVMTEYYGSGRFCCRQCANARNHSEETKAKIRKSAINHISNTYHIEPRYCSICGIPIKNKNRSGYCAYCCRRYKLVSEDTRKKLSEINKRGRELGTIKSWLPRNKISPNETLWMGVLDKHNIQYKHEAVIKKSDLGVVENGIYKLDFLIDDNIDLEIDSKIHRYPDRKQHDEIRDARLKNAGYKVYRIKCYNKDYTDNIQSIIEDFIDWYKSQSRADGSSFGS